MWRPLEFSVSNVPPGEFSKGAGDSAKCWKHFQPVLVPCSCKDWQTRWDCVRFFFGWNCRTWGPGRSRLPGPKAAGLRRRACRSEGGNGLLPTTLTSVLTQPPLEHFHNQPAPTFIERLKNNSGWIFMFFADSDVNARLAFCQQEWDNVACRWLQNPTWLVVGDKETKMLEAHQGSKYPHQPSPARELLAS